MSAYDPNSEATIDPALREQPAQTQTNTQPPQQTIPSPTKGKRKARTSTSTSAGAGGSSGTSPANARVTRRSAANSNAPGGAGGTSTEPSRGEEENLIGYWGQSSRKRPRKESPTKRAVNRFYPTSGNGAVASTSSGTAIDWAGPSNVNTDVSAGVGGQDTNDKIDPQLATAKTRPIFPYPFGLTPFRYPCLTPDLPPPAPGDPTNPNFHKFDPHSTNTTVTTTTTSNEKPSAPSSSSSLPPPAQPETTLASAEVEIDPALALQAETDASNAAYESISALLSASQAFTENGLPIIPDTTA